ncbi:MAG TPA: phytoene/squalene synthase family protein [Candidatus Eisenbacteria bacterium]|nr:phytoene/squalene synthase family protein [Candidatus Eisenbacteria bacterium]
MGEPIPAEVRAALDECRWMIHKGSKSFSLAARLFEPETRDAACFLYGWCRYCDDQVDGPAGGPAAVERVQALKDKTMAAFSSAPQNEPVFIALQHVVRRYGIPAHYPLELIEGMAMDARGTDYRTFEDLLLYCYRVAGTVGLMMSHVMRLRDQAALKHAADLGIAMQLTNIARDITEDAAMGRIYLPLDWLDDVGIPRARVAAPEQRERLALLTRRLLDEAERYYRSGDAGLWYLSFRSACAVAAARHVYAEIGRVLRRRGARAWDSRTHVSAARKLRLVALALASVTRSIPARWARPWSPVVIRTVLKTPFREPIAR